MLPRCGAILGLALVGMTLLGCAKNPDTIVRDLRSSIQQTLPVGSDRDRVAAFLQSHGIERFTYSERTRTLYAMIRNASRSFFGLFRTDIQLQFHFDDEDKLIRYTVEKVVTSL